MSYEGYEQVLCAKGHLAQYDCYDEVPEKCRIKGCNEKIVWRNSVNVTNGSYDDDGKRIDGYVELKPKSKKICKCKCCGNVHLKEAITYHIPKKVKK